MFNKKRGQLTLGDAPTVVLIVGLVFLIMATIALVGQKYGDSMPTDYTAVTTSEPVTKAVRETTAGARIGNSSLCRAEGYAIVEVRNTTDGVLISAGNYTLSTTGYLKNTSTSTVIGDWSVNATTKYAGVACDVTEDLQTNVSENTSIAGIVLTISLVGIVLTVLIGIFVGMRRRSL